jgi:hypothetical protein
MSKMWLGPNFAYLAIRYRHTSRLAKPMAWSSTEISPSLD